MTLSAPGFAAGTAAVLTWLARAVLWLLYPPHCALCEQVLTGPGALRAGFCTGCLDAMPLARGPRQLARSVTTVETGFPVLSAGEYGGPLREAIHVFKFGRRDDLARPLAGMMADLVAGLERRRGGVWRRPAIIVPVPLHPARERWRGFNQSRLLAARLSTRLGIPLAPPRALRRRWRTPSQTGRGVRRRQENMSGAFRAGWRRGLAGRRILLVDDVMTTGATLRACAAALDDAGAGKVTGLVLARTTKRSPTSPPESEATVVPSE